ncbi:hypothetical protein VWH05_03585 [Escherichia coli O157]|nr:hypothetical protein [Escherichia coli O157]
MSFSKEERDLIKKAIWFYANEGKCDEEKARELCNIFEKKQDLKVYRIRDLDEGDRIVLAETKEEAEQIVTDKNENPHWMEEVCDVKKGTYID